MLNNAGYGVGRGTASPGATYGASVLSQHIPWQSLPDSQIQSDLNASINSGLLALPDSNRLYVVFVEDDVVVSSSSGDSRPGGNAGYHGAFLGWCSAFGMYTDIHYAVITYPGGNVNNGGFPWLNVQNSMTLTASHEIAEAVTDPNVKYNT